MGKSAPTCDISVSLPDVHSPGVHVEQELSVEPEKELAARRGEPEQESGVEREEQASKYARQNRQFIDHQQQDDVVTLEIENDGTVVPKSQLTDYQYRGAELEHLSLYTFVRDTYNLKLRPFDQEHMDASHVLDEGTHPGRPPNQRVLYLDGHPRQKSRFRMVRSKGHNVLTNIIGGYFPPERDAAKTDMFLASMLALLKPWRTEHDLRLQNQTWRSAFEQWHTSATSEAAAVLDCIRFGQRSQEAAAREREVAEAGEFMESEVQLTRRNGNSGADDPSDECGINTVTFHVSEDDVKRMKEMQAGGAGDRHATKGLALAIEVGHLPVPGGAWRVQRDAAGRADGGQLQQLEKWNEALASDQGAQVDLFGEVLAGPSDEGTSTSHHGKSISLKQVQAMSSRPSCPKKAHLHLQLTVTVTSLWRHRKLKTLGAADPKLSRPISDGHTTSSLVISSVPMTESFQNLSSCKCTAKVVLARAQ